VLLAGPNREPLWPRGIVGSITHKAGFCAAAAGRRQHFAGIGIDAELDDAIAPGVAARACTSGELERLKRATWLEPLVGARAVFSAKESLYKLQFPITQRHVGFSDVAIELFPDGGFSATFLTDVAAFTAGTELRGHWLRQSGYIVTGLWLCA